MLTWALIGPNLYLSTAHTTSTMTPRIVGRPSTRKSHFAVKPDIPKHSLGPSALIEVTTGNTDLQVTRMNRKHFCSKRYHCDHEGFVGLIIVTAVGGGGGSTAA